ncbi:MAG: hypothetical protein ACLR2E_16015 [Lachnospiraceae bacterium]
MNRYDMTLDGTENNLVQGLTVENPTGLKATLLSQTGKMQNLFLPYPAKGTLSFPNGRLEDVPIHFEAENGKWFSVRENTARYAAVENPFEKDFLSTVRNCSSYGTETPCLCCIQKK